MDADYQHPVSCCQHLPVGFSYHNPVMSSLATRLKQARTNAKLSQEALAKKAGVSQSLIGNLESGNQKSTSKVAQIAAALGVEALWLATGKGKPRPTILGVHEPSAGYDALTPEERAMLETYRMLTREQRNEHLRRAEATQQANASIIAELAGKGHDGTDGQGVPLIYSTAAGV